MSGRSSPAAVVVALRSLGKLFRRLSFPARQADNVECQQAVTLAIFGRDFIRYRKVDDSDRIEWHAGVSTSARAAKTPGSSRSVLTASQVRSIRGKRRDSPKTGSCEMEGSGMMGF